MATGACCLRMSYTLRVWPSCRAYSAPTGPSPRCAWMVRVQMGGALGVCGPVGGCIRCRGPDSNGSVTKVRIWIWKRPCVLCVLLWCVLCLPVVMQTPDTLCCPAPTTCMRHVVPRMLFIPRASYFTHQRALFYGMSPTPSELQCHI